MFGGKQVVVCGYGLLLVKEDSISVLVISTLFQQNPSSTDTLCIKKGDCRDEISDTLVNICSIIEWPY